jgi:hypothetical protein
MRARGERRADVLADFEGPQWARGALRGRVRGASVGGCPPPARGLDRCGRPEVDQVRCPEAGPSGRPGCGSGRAPGESGGGLRRRGAPRVPRRAPVGRGAGLPRASQGLLAPLRLCAIFSALAPEGFASTAAPPPPTLGFPRRAAKARRAGPVAGRAPSAGPRGPRLDRPMPAGRGAGLRGFGHRVLAPLRLRATSPPLPRMGSRPPRAFGASLRGSPAKPRRREPRAKRGHGSFRIPTAHATSRPAEGRCSSTPTSQCALGP